MLTKGDLFKRYATLPDDAVIYVIEAEPSDDFDNSGLPVVDATIEPGDRTAPGNLGYGYIHVLGLERTTTGRGSEN